MNYLQSGALIEENPWLQYLQGLALIAAVAFAAIEAAEVTWFQAHGISVPTLAIVLGMIVGNTIYPRLAHLSARGVTFSKQTLLRAGIVLYGLRLTFQDIGRVGVPGVVIDALVLSSTFALSCWAGTRIFKLDPRCAMLIGAGSSVCGAAAVMASEPVIGGRSDEVATAVSTVVVFGTLAMFLYPLMYDLNLREHYFAMSPTQYGVYAGSTIHEVAQVVAAGRAVAESAANTAVITKMVRVMMLAPFLLALSAYLSRSRSRMEQRCAGMVIPWFALGFVAMAGLNSLNILSSVVVSSALSIDTVILAMAMAALGVTTHVSAIRTAGLKPLALAASLFAWLVAAGFFINAGVRQLFGA